MLLAGYQESEMAGGRVAHVTLKGPSVVREICIGIALGLAAGSLWKMHHWNEQRKVRSFYDLLEKDMVLNRGRDCGAVFFGFGPATCLSFAQMERVMLAVANFVCMEFNKFNLVGSFRVPFVFPDEEWLVRG
ncbi:hypothetical protein DKX38_003311 [Salix brachista]|uniref:Cytochrome c oxidase subunit 5C n=1 Tax=Salix brachista TaxID=2182728 RepID=A0A5N5NRD8_9ROSI|nr:hypothetical protein DKX38_003311 [Salix brachista]